MRRISVLLFFFLFALLASAQESLTIGPGDQIRINVFDTPELSQDVRVTDGGEVTLLMGGKVKVSSLLPAQAAKAIENTLVSGKVMRQPSVSVTITQYATQAVSVLGQVNHPGAYPILTPRTILEVLTDAGGLTELANRKVAIRRHASGATLDYYVSNDASEAMNSQILVYPGDTVFVPKVGVVYVLGDVGRPGGYAIATNDSRLTVLQVTSLAGGANKTAVTAHVRLIHKTVNGYQELPIHLNDMQKGKIPDMPLEADDIVYVPFSYLKNFAVGADGLVAAAASAAVYHY
jgi:polysaccharide export outer membrane protein